MMSWAARFQLRQYVRQSLWVVPLLGTVAGALLAAVDLRLEGKVPLPDGWTYSASTAGSLLSAVAGAMIGLLGLVVTIGVLVVQMATGTLSPRFMRLWYRDRLQKVVLAAFMATFAFSFALLRDVDSGGVPNLGVTLAGLAVTVDMILLLLYLDRFVDALRPVAVAAAMSRAGLAVVNETEDQPPIRDAGEVPWPEGAGLQVRAPSTGAIQAIATWSIVKYAHDHDLVCVFRRPVGDFVNGGSPLIELHGQAPADAERRLGGMVALGHERTIEQDPAFAVRIIVDIAIRALSPAVNDPTSSSACACAVEERCTAEELPTTAPSAPASRTSPPTRRARRRSSSSPTHASTTASAPAPSAQISPESASSSAASAARRRLARARPGRPGDDDCPGDRADPDQTARPVAENHVLGADDEKDDKEDRG